MIINVFLILPSVPSLLVFPFIYLFMFIFIKHLSSFECSIVFYFLWLPMDYNPPGSSLHGIVQARNTGAGCHLLLPGTFLTGIKPASLTLAGGFFTTSSKNSTGCLIHPLVKQLNKMKTCHLFHGLKIHTFVTWPFI